MSLRTSSNVVTVMYGVRPCPTIPEDPWYQPPNPYIHEISIPATETVVTFPDWIEDLLEETRKNNDIKSLADKLKTIARRLKRLGMKKLGREITKIAASLYDLVEKEEN